MDRPIIDSDDEETMIFMEPYCSEARLLMLASSANDFTSTIPMEANELCNIDMRPLQYKLVAADNEEMQAFSHSSYKSSNTEFEIKRAKKENKYFKFSFNKEVVKNWKSGFSNYWPNDLSDINDCLILRRRYRNEETKDNLRSRVLRNSADSPFSSGSSIYHYGEEDYSQPGKQKDSLVKHPIVINSVHKPIPLLVSDTVDFPNKNSNGTMEVCGDMQKVYGVFKNDRDGADQSEVKKSRIKSTAESINEDQLSDLCFDPHRYERCKIYIKGKCCKERYCRDLHKFPREDNVYCRSYLKTSKCRYDYSCPYLHCHPDSSSLKLSLNKRKPLPSSKSSTHNLEYFSNEKNNLYRYENKNTLTSSIDDLVKSYLVRNSDTIKGDMTALNKNDSEKYNGSISSSHTDELNSSVKNSNNGSEDKIEVSDIDCSVDESTDDEIASLPGSPNNSSSDGESYKFPVLLGVGDILAQIRSKQNNSQKEKVPISKKLNDDQLFQVSPKLKEYFSVTDNSTNVEKLVDNLISQIRLDEQSSFLEKKEIISNTALFQFDHIPLTIDSSKELELQIASSEDLSHVSCSSSCDKLEANRLRSPAAERVVCFPVVNKFGLSENNPIKNKTTLIYSDNNYAATELDRASISAKKTELDLPCHLDVSGTHSPYGVGNLSHHSVLSNDDSITAKSHKYSTSDTQSIDSFELSKITHLPLEKKQEFLKVSPEQKKVFCKEFHFQKETEQRPHCESFVSVEKPILSCSVQNTSNLFLIAAEENKTDKITSNSINIVSTFENTNNDSPEEINNGAAIHKNNGNSTLKLEISKTYSSVNTLAMQDEMNEAVLSTGVDNYNRFYKDQESNKSDCDSDSSCENSHRPIMSISNLVDLLKHKQTSENIKRNDNLDPPSLSLKLVKSKLRADTNASPRQKETLEKSAKQTNMDRPTLSADLSGECNKNSLKIHQLHDVRLSKTFSKGNHSIKKKVIDLLPSSFLGKESTKKKSGNHRKESSSKNVVQTENTHLNVAKNKFKDFMSSSGFSSRKSSSSKENKNVSKSESPNLKSSKSTFKIPKLGKKSLKDCFAKETDRKNCLKSTKNDSAIPKVSSDRYNGVKKVRDKKPTSKRNKDTTNNKFDSVITDQNIYKQGNFSPLSDKIISNQNFNSAIKIQNYHSKPKPKCKKKNEKESDSRLLLKRKSNFDLSPELSLKKPLIETNLPHQRCAQILNKKDGKNKASLESPIMDNPSFTLSEKEDFYLNDCSNKARKYLQNYSPEYDSTNDVCKQFESLCEKFKINCVERSKENDFEMLDRNVRRFALKLVALDNECEVNDAQMERTLNDLSNLSLSAFIELVNTK